MDSNQFSVGQPNPQAGLLEYEVPSRWTLIGGSSIITAVAVRAILELMNKSRRANAGSTGLRTVCKHKSSLALA
jgi:hypothetical protein